MDILKLDYSKTDSFYQCPRKYWLKYVKLVTSTFGSTALRFGSTFHGAMEGYYSYIQEHGWKKDGKAVEQGIVFAKKEWEDESEDRIFHEDYRTFQNLLDVFLRYIDYFYQDEGMLGIKHTERAFQLLMKPTEADKKAFGWLVPFYFTGKIDQECTLNRADWLNEFKTTGWSLVKLKDELIRSPQVIGYAYASKKVYDVMPDGSLVTIAYATSRKSKKTGNYGKLTVDFARVPQMYNSHDLSQWREHFISLVAQVQLAHQTNHFPPRFQSCFNFGRCEFLNLCEQSIPLEKCSYYNYADGKEWDVTTEVNGEAVMYAEE